jgi:hypothetical protein
MVYAGQISVLKNTDVSETFYLMNFAVTVLRLHVKNLLTEIK